MEHLGIIETSRKMGTVPSRRMGTVPSGHPPLRPQINFLFGCPRVSR